jgi:3-oxoacyl-[acyl-carrier protein] reductase
MTGKLAGRTAIVTGAASGIGAATVRRLIADGASVLAIDLTPDNLTGTHTLVADLGDPAAFAVIASAAETHLGGLDILINNAGVCPAGPLDTMTDADWDFALSINMTAALKLSRAVVPMLRKSKAGRIINTASILASFGNVGLVAYTASKHGILGLTRGLAAELGPDGITVNAIQPGCIVTGMTQSMLDSDTAVEAYYVQRCLLGRLGQPEDIADVFAFLASDDARFITGQGIFVDGGLMAHG